jgi:hypothetical protein
MRRVLAHLIFACAAIGLSDPARAQPADDIRDASFQLPQSDHQIVLAGRIYDRPSADIVAVSRQGGQTRLQVFALIDQDWVGRASSLIPPDGSGFDIAMLGGRDVLLVLGPDGLDRFEVGTGRRVSIHASPIATAWTKDVLRVVDLSRDLNGDGLDDLIIPTRGGLQILVQRPDGALETSARLDWLPHAQMPARVDGDRHDLLDESRTRVADFDLDGRADLVQWRPDHFAVYLQTADGGFASEPVRFDGPDLFDSDDPAYLVAPGSVRYRVIDHDVGGHFTGRVLDGLADMTGDGIPDLSVFHLRGEGLMGLRHGYSVHAGSRGTTGLVFDADPVTHFEQGGIPFGLERQDIDGDGRPEILVTALPPNLLAMIGGVIFRRMRFDVDIHSISGRDLDTPVITRPLRTYGLGQSDTTAAQFSPVMVTDFNGDARMDLLIGRAGHGLDVYHGEAGSTLVARRSERINLPMRPGIDRLIVKDLDGDGAADLILHAPGQFEPGRATVRLSPAPRRSDND